jgi:hypothetical protein
MFIILHVYLMPYNMYIICILNWNYTANYIDMIYYW